MGADLARVDSANKLVGLSCGFERVENVILGCPDRLVDEHC
jgi:hypothetical protein